MTAQPHLWDLNCRNDSQNNLTPRGQYLGLGPAGKAAKQRHTDIFCGTATLFQTAGEGDGATGYLAEIGWKPLRAPQSVAGYSG
jgi:hypothetical protein